MNQSLSLTQRIILLWLVITIGMLFHQFFSLHNLRFGADVIKSGYDQTPPVELTKRMVLYVLPLMYIVINALWQLKMVRVLNLVAAPFYLMFHTWHFAHEWGKMTDPVQWVLLSFLIVWSGLLVYSCWKWVRLNS